MVFIGENKVRCVIYNIVFVLLVVLSEKKLLNINMEKYYYYIIPVRSSFIYLCI